MRHADDGTAKPKKQSLGKSFNTWFGAAFNTLLVRYEGMVKRVLEWPRAILAVFGVVFLLSLLLFPMLGLSFFPRTDPAQFVINFKAPSGTKLKATEEETARLEGMVRQIVSKHDMGMIVSNIGLDPGFSALFSPNSAMHTGFMQVALNPDHATSSFDYIRQVKQKMSTEMPELQAFFSTGSLVDGVLNMGSPV